MQKLELLAPAKNYTTAIDAINSGADAVYIGANLFGARHSASNSIEDIKKVTDYAHLFNVKVYVTLNTILDDDELIEAEKIIKQLYKIKVDAVIIQDFGILNLAAENKLPPIVLHASTQCDIRDLEKVKFFEEIGLKRVILARELTLTDIEKIRKNTNIELEHFIAGALCVCYSGQCYLSSYIGQRSANRGQCAQACRKQYSLINKKGEYLAKNKYLLSLKDNNLSSHLDKLIKAGVTSFKIEGRLKDENFIKNNVYFYHKLLEKYPRISKGKILADFTPKLEKTFNRGFCDDYLFNKKDNIYNFLTPKSTGEFLGKITSINENNFTVKTNSSVNPQDGLIFISDNSISGCLVNKTDKLKDGIKIYPNKKLNLKKGDGVYRNLDTEFNKTLKNTVFQRKLEIKFIVYKDKITVFDEDNNKTFIEFVSQETAKDKDKMKDNFIKSLSKTTDTPFLVSDIEFKTEDIPFLPVSKVNEIRREISEKLKELILSRYKVKKQPPLNIAKFPKDKGDYRLNVHNKKAREFYELCGCKVCQDSFEKLKDKKNLELMRTKHCLKRAFLDCGTNEELYLVDEKNVKYPLKFDCKNCEMVILSP